MPTSPLTRPSRHTWRGADRSLGARVALTYAAVAGATTLALLVGLPLALLASQQGEGWDGLGYFFVTIGLAAVAAVVVAAAATWFLDLGWATVLGLLGLAVPLAAAGLLRSGAAALLVALVWPAVVALAVHGRLLLATAVTAGALVLGVGATWVQDERVESRRAASITADLERSGLTLYGPPDGAELEWQFVMVHADGDVAYRVQDETRRYEVEQGRELLVDPGPVADGEIVRDPQHNAVLTRRDGTVVLVRAFPVDGAAEADLDAAEELLGSLVERSPEWLGERSRDTRER